MQELTLVTGEKSSYYVKIKLKNIKIFVINNILCDV